MTYDILVTGGAGYLGSSLVPALLAAGHRVTVLDNFMFRQTTLNHVCHHPNFTVVKGDIRIESVVAQIEGVAGAIRNGASRLDLLRLLPAGAARTAPPAAVRFVANGTAAAARLTR